MEQTYLFNKDMRKMFLILMLTTMCFQQINAKPINDIDKVKALEEKCSILQNKQVNADKNLRKLVECQHVAERKIQTLVKENEMQRLAIDSLQNKCKSLEEVQSTDRVNLNGKIDATDNNVRTNQDLLHARTLWGIVTIIVVLAIIIGLAHRLTKRIKLGTSTIGDVRKAQEALQIAQTKMQEEALSLDNKLIEIAEKQIEASSTSEGKNEIDHSLVLKVADEIVRIELNMSRMDSSIKGYKQLAKAVERIKDNFSAKGYEIVDMLGKPYNEGMKVIANFVADEDLEKGKQIITGITKPQINYNGQMIQAAQITVSQNI